MQVDLLLNLLILSHIYMTLLEELSTQEMTSIDIVIHLQFLKRNILRNVLIHVIYDTWTLGDFEYEIFMKGHCV